MATPFHWLRPTCATSYPASVNACMGNCLSEHLVSCMASTSVPERSSQEITLSARARIEFTFQVANRMTSPYFSMLTASICAYR
ncbi:hypothetical protein CCUG62472_03525 [Mycobacteroides salmoniphilum]|nr:hypothetical protein CCUG62472_03525 [Mycobacteroides salmoniphilum]